jgi:poly(3-hydroxybutyrate) depolymerase
LVNHNNSLERAIEGLYPDLGHGDAPASQSDATLAVRQDFGRRPFDDDSEPVSVITVIDGGHEWSGKSGNQAPCGNRNCDIDTTEEILQFWRAHAGLRNKWP